MPERFGYAYRLELRLILRQWLYWVLLAGIGLFMLSTSMELTVWSHMVIGAYGWVSMGLLGMIMYVVFVAARPARNRMDVLEATLPVGAELPFARMAAVLTCQIPLIVMPVTLPLVRHALSGDPFPMLPVYLAEAAITVIFATLLAWWICTVMPVRRVTFVLVAFVWLGGYVISVMLNGPAVAHLTSALRFLRYIFYSDLWGWMPFDGLPWLFDLFYIGLIILLAGLIVWLIHRRRFYRTTAAVRGVIGVGALVTLAGYGLYAAEFHRMMSANEMPGFYGYGYSRPTSLDDFPRLDYAVTRYDVVLDVADVPRFGVTMDVANTGGAALEALDFSLMPEVTVSDASVPFTHESGLLTLRFTPPLAAGETRTVELAYAGSINKYFYRYGSPPRAEAFVRAGGINLPRNIFWYPKAGTVTNVLYDPREEILTTPAPFRLTVTGSALPVYSNLPQTGEGVFESAGTTWAMLLSSPHYGRWSLADGGITLLASEERYRMVRDRMGDALADIRAVLALYFPDDSLIILSEFTYLATNDVAAGDAARMDDYAAVSTSYTPYYQNYEYWLYPHVIYPAVQHYLGARIATSLTENVGRFIALQIDHDGDVAAMRAALPPPPGTMFESEPPPGYVYPDLIYAVVGHATYYTVTEALVEVYAEHGTAGVRAVLGAIQADARRLETLFSADIAAWIAAWAAENLAGGGES